MSLTLLVYDTKLKLIIKAWSQSKNDLFKYDERNLIKLIEWLDNIIRYNDKLSKKSEKKKV